MIELKIFDNWREDKVSGKFGSGASEKVWLINPETSEKGLFKFPKVKDKEKGIITGEYWAEKLATEIGKLIDVECAKVDIGTYKGRIGSMSYSIIQDRRIFREGIDYIQAKYPYYNKENLVEEYSNKCYSFQMIENTINGVLKLDEILKMMLFDCLIGNSDRHHSNWGVVPYIKKGDTKYHICSKLSPLYDNGSSLCAYEDNNDIEIFFKDKMKFEALVNTKSRSAIGWENERPIKHFDLLKKLKDNQYSLTIKYIEKIKNNINKESIEKILNEFDNDIISENMKKLLKMYILERRKRMLDIYELKDEV